MQTHSKHALSRAIGRRLGTLRELLGRNRQDFYVALDIPQPLRYLPEDAIDFTAAQIVRAAIYLDLDIRVMFDGIVGENRYLPPELATLDRECLAAARRISRMDAAARRALFQSALSAEANTGAAA